MSRLTASLTNDAITLLLFLCVPFSLNAEIQGIPASDSLGAEDIWRNPVFRGGVVNGGPTAHSEW